MPFSKVYKVPRVVDLTGFGLTMECYCGWMICFTSLHTVMGVAVTNPLSTKPPDTDTEVVNFFLADYVNLLKDFLIF